MLWFSSDFHLNHGNIIKYSHRPFSSVEDMNKTIIDNCNAVIKSNDTFYFLGDWAFTNNGRISSAIEFAEQINCKKIHFILGNHDHAVRRNKEQLVKDRIFLSVQDFLELDVSGYTEATSKIVLCHYALRVWNKSHYGTYHLYAHSHGSLADDPHSRSFDCGVDTNNFRPYSLDDVIQRMSLKQWKPIDHYR